MKHFYKYIIMCLPFLMAACTASIPKDAKIVDEVVPTYPDYSDVVVPCNIAPLNFHIDIDNADDYVTKVEGTDGTEIIVGGQDAMFDVDEWHNLLDANKGKQLSFTIYVCQDGKWTQYKPICCTVAEEPIDEYLSYRYIEPGYVNYRELSICQRNLTNFDEELIYSNLQKNEVDIANTYQCVNCHSYQNYHTDNFQLHVRQYKGGTVLYHDGKLSKINIKTDETIGNGVYTSWHPTEPLIAYSLNHTVQCFLIGDADHKIEVLDTLSDLVLYHVDTNEVQIVQNSIDSYETYPSWAPTGDTLYYCSAYYPIEGTAHHFALGNHYDSIYYDIIRQSYDVATSQFGDPDTVFRASAIHKSATHPRVSPDGRYLLFSLGDYGNFQLHHTNSDLWMKDLRTDSLQKLSNMSTEQAESYHVWSSNGRWIVFSTRKEDATYTRLYIGYFDRQGHDFKAFPLPQRDPLYNKKLMKSFNLPELTVEPVKISPREIADVIEKDAKMADIYKK